EDYLIRISALSLLKNHKEYYLQDDILLMEKISEKINSSFPNIGVIYEDKNMWQCECGKVNKNSVIFCKSCKKNIKGFTINDPEPDEVLKILKNRIDALKRIFLANPE